jgi:ribosomal protein S18 acetylase RimI-like enzyme
VTGRTTVRVRRARPSELGAAGAVAVAAYEPFTLGPDDAYLEKLRDAGTRDREAELWVAVIGTRVVGCVTSCPPGSPWRELAGPEEGEFRMLAVDPTARNLGVGAALVERCEERARAHGARAMVLSSLHEMADAHRLYTRLGYRRDASRDWEPVPGVALVTFVKDLS